MCLLYFIIFVDYYSLKEVIDDQHQEEVKDVTSGEEVKKVAKVVKENKVNLYW